MTEPDPALVREFMVLSRLREPDDMREVTPPEVRYFNSYYPAHVEREKRAAQRRAQQEEWDRQRRESAKEAAHRAWLMKDMRKWGPENGFFVGTRGRIPRAVIEAYNEAKGHA
ncbi:histone-like nucleoid-structuring protein Lsr2 [Streptomyces sp. SS7]|uniref:Lsr2 family DNA-binding protein n=1 Tax=Streptomyces sp. SS7 TaxID=3108485 RepID=UPI0030EE391D